MQHAKAFEHQLSLRQRLASLVQQARRDLDAHPSALDAMPVDGIVSITSLLDLMERADSMAVPQVQFLFDFPH